MVWSWFTKWLDCDLIFDGICKNWKLYDIVSGAVISKQRALMFPKHMEVSDCIPVKLLSLLFVFQNKTVL